MRKDLRYIALGVVLGLATLPAIASGATYVAKQDLSQLERKVRHELVTLPFYSLFDNLEFRVDGDKVKLTGQVRRPSLKTSAEKVVTRIEGVSSVENQIEVLPLSSYGQVESIVRGEPSDLSPNDPSETPDTAVTR